MTSMGSPLDAGRRIAALIGKADDAPGVIRAYHGSPHSFSRFDASRIGTGEGAQSFGHGLYFAGSEDTADFYRRKLAEDGDAPERWARDYWAAQAQPGSFGSPEEAYDYLLSHIRSIRNAGPGSSYSPGLKKHYAAAEKWLLSQSPYTVPDPIRQGHMYEVEIGHPEQALLDLDSPIGDQPQAIQDALGSYGRAPWHFTLGQENWRGSNALSEIKDNLSGSAPDAARTLLERGIPGVRYFDGVSRPSGEGTRNYVMFPGTEDRISILRQYGLLPPLVGAGMMEEE
jgi:hypothetical protein